MPRKFQTVNFGDAITLTPETGEKTVCSVSIDNLDAPELERMRTALESKQWVVEARALPVKYGAGSDNTQPLYVVIRIVSGHGGMSTNRDVGVTPYVKTTGAGSSIEVRARLVDAFGVTALPSNAAFAGASAIVNVSVRPGTDKEAEPVLWWTPIMHAALNVPIKLPSQQAGAAAPTTDKRLTQQRLRRVRVSQTNDGGGLLFLQLIDSLNAPTPAVPGMIIMSERVPIESPTTAETDIDFGYHGIPFSRGCWARMSSAQDTTVDPAGAGPWHLRGQLYRLDSGEGTS